MSQKTCHCVTVHYLRRILANFQNAFTGTFCIQFAITGSVATHLRCGGIITNRVTANVYTSSSSSSIVVVVVVVVIHM